MMKGMGLELCMTQQCTGPPCQQIVGVPAESYTLWSGMSLEAIYSESACSVLEASENSVREVCGGQYLRSCTCCQGVMTYIRIASKPLAVLPG